MTVRESFVLDVLEEDCLIGKDVDGSRSKSLRCKRSSSRKQGGPAIGTICVASICLA